jgi:hypothetical protein
MTVVVLVLIVGAAGYWAWTVKQPLPFDSAKWKGPRGGFTRYRMAEDLRDRILAEH